MTEIPEHLLKRAQAAREKAAGGDASSTGGASDRIPDQLLDRTKAAGSGVAVADKPAAVATAAGLSATATPEPAALVRSSN